MSAPLGPAESVDHVESADCLRTADGVRLALRWWRPAGGSESSPLGVVVVHGFAGTKDHPGVVALAEALAAAGHTVLAYDGRGHGASEGWCTLGQLEPLDVAAAVERMREVTDRVVTVGGSMGAMAVLGYAPLDPELAGVVAVSGPARWELPRTARGLLALALTQTRPGRWVTAARLGVRVATGWTNPPPPVELVSRLEVPFAVVHGRRDRFLPARAAVSLYTAAAEPRRLVLVDGMGHSYESAAVAPIVGAVDWALARCADEPLTNR